MLSPNWIKEIKISLVGYLGAGLLSLIRKTLVIDRSLTSELSNSWRDEEAKIFVFWHGQQLMMPWFYLDSETQGSNKQVHVLISRSQDGRFIAKAMQVLKINSIAGSSSRGGIKALNQLVKVVKNGQHVAITPDGPKGPEKKVKSGALKVAQLSGAKIIPFSFAAKNCWRFNSWDKMILPKPFSKAAYACGRPISVPKDADEKCLTELAYKLEEELNRITIDAERILNK